MTLPHEKQEIEDLAAGVLAFADGKLIRRSRAELAREVEERKLPLEADINQATRDELVETLRWSVRFNPQAKEEAQKAVELVRLERAARSIGTDLHRGARF